MEYLGGFLLQKIIRVSLILALNFIIVCYLPLTVINAKTLVGTVYSRESSTPTIDGVLNAAEWSEGIAQNITLYDIRDQSNELVITIMSLYDVEEMLYLGITIYDNKPGLDELAIMIRVAEAELVSTIGTTYIDVILGEEHDVKMMYLHNNVTGDFANTFIGPVSDENYGGKNDLVGKCHYYEDSHITTELAMPFNSSDVRHACDPLIHVNDKLELFIAYYNETITSTFYQIRMDDGDFEYVILDIGGSSKLFTNNLTIIAAIISLLFVNIIYLKKRKRINN